MRKVSRSLCPTLCAIVVMSAAGCGTAPSFGPLTVPDGPSASGEGGPSSAMIGAEGGTLQTPDGVEIDIPAGALTSSTALAVRRISDVPMPPSGTRVGATYSLQPEGLTFEKPIRITLPIDDAALKHAGGSAVDVRVFTSEHVGEELTPLAAVAVDDQHVATATMHFSVYVPALVSSTDACGDGLAAYDACGLQACKWGTHRTWTANQANCPINPQFPIYGSHCVPNGSWYVACDELGCAGGFHFVGQVAGACLLNPKCVLTQGPVYDACELGCSPGYHMTGIASGIDCTINGIQIGAHCVADDGVGWPNPCEQGAYSGATRARVPA